MVGMIVKKQSSQWWWLDNNQNKSTPTRSSWLQSTLSELDRNTEAMRRLIEADADSFAQRAEMYYKKRPELIGMVEEFYRAHRSLAEKHQLLRSESGTRVLTSLRSPFSSPEIRYRPCDDDVSEICESEVDDPDHHQDEDGDNRDEEEDECVTPPPGPRRDPVWGEIKKLREEIRRLEEEKEAQGEMLKLKDEEKKEAIRHLSLAVDMLKEDNVKLRKSLLLLKQRDGVTPPRKRTQFQFSVFKEGLFGKLFNGSSHEYYPVVPL